MSLLEPRLIYAPFVYQQAYDTFADALRRNPTVMSAYADGFELDDALVQRAFRDKHLYIAYQQKTLS